MYRKLCRKSRKYSFLFRDCAEYSKLDYSDSYSIKGLLILIIVLGHNKYLMEEGMAFKYLYSFHVYGFYFLPFLYNFKVVNLSVMVRKNAIRLLVPYTLVFCLLAILNRSVFDINMMVCYFSGSQVLLREVLHSGGFLWFLPTMFSLLCLRHIYYTVSYSKRLMLVAVSLLCWFCYAFGYFGIVQIYAPMSIFIAFAMLLPGIFVREISNKESLPVLSMFFFLLTIAVAIVFPVDEGKTYKILKWIICPILINSFLISSCSVYKKITFLSEFGKYSFGIYVIHLFLYNIIYKYGEPMLPLKNNYVIGILSFISVLLMSYMLCKIKIVNIIFNLK